MTSAPSQPLSVQPPQNFSIQEPVTCCSVLFDLAEVIGGLAVRALFVFATILTTAVLFPIAWHWIVLPITTLGSISMAAFFFPKFHLTSTPDTSPMNPRPSALPANGLLPESYPPESAIGYNRVGQNCAFNAMAHFFDLDPRMGAWMRQRFVDPGIGLEPFIQALARFQAPAIMIEQFRQFVNAPPPAGTVRPNSIPDLFSLFLRQREQQLREAAARPDQSCSSLSSLQNQPSQAELEEIKRVNSNFHLFQYVLPNFYETSDRDAHARRAVSAARSDTIRTALSGISPLIPPSNGEQTDAGDIARALLDFLPPDQKVHIETAYHYNMNGLPQMQEAPQPQRARCTLLELPLEVTDPDGIPLETLVNRYCRQSQSNSLRRLGVDGQPHDYPVNEATVEFVEPPPALRFQIKRFTWQSLLPSIWSQLFPSLFPPVTGQGVKLNTQVAMPDRLSIRLQNGQICNYVLAGFATHTGSYNSGHYTSGEIRGGRKYLHNDSLVTLVENPETEGFWERRKNSSYLVCYLPEPPLNQPAQ